LGYKVIGCSRRGSNVHVAATSVISATSAVGDDGVSDVEGAEVSDAAAGDGCRISRDCGISEGDGAAGDVVDAAAEECGITREGGIGDVEVAGVEDAAAIVYGCRIVIQGGIGEGEGATVADAAAGTAR